MSDPTPMTAALLLEQDMRGIPPEADYEEWLRKDLDEVAELARRLERDRARLAGALRVLYEETADYIRINNLGDVHHNRSMQMARAALASLEEKP